MAATGLPVTTASLTLRAFVPGDAPALYRMSREAGMQAWLPSQVYRDEAQAASVLAFLISAYDAPGDPRRGPYVLGVQRGGELIGHVGFSPFEGGVEVGFAIAQAHHGQGLGTAAVRAGCEWAARSFSLPAILGITAADNVAAQAVMRAAGFVHHGVSPLRFQGRDQPVARFTCTTAATP
jgi:RimJ/RimL family protein N-acetyltransferase